MKLPPYFMVFDVESVGLHGEGFAVGWVVVDDDGREIEAHRIACHPSHAQGSDAGRQWVAENVPRLESEPFVVPSVGLVPTTTECLRSHFWNAWLEWRAKEAVLVTDCGWPVEARFLAACVDDQPEEREWSGPYPLHELATFCLAAGLPTLGSGVRMENELPIHDPLADARQSARLLRAAILQIRAMEEV